MSGQHHAPAALPSVKNHGTNWRPGGAQNRAGRFGEQKISYPYQDQTRDRPVRSLVCVPTVLFRLYSNFPYQFQIQRAGGDKKCLTST
jgi:hypothetical protein